MGISGGAGRWALGHLIRGSELGARGRSLGGTRGLAAREWASAPSPAPRTPPAGAALLPAASAPGARGRWPWRCECAPRAWARDPDRRSPTPILPPPTPHPPFLPWLVAGEWVSRNRHAAEKTGRRRNQITHLQLRARRANKSGASCCYFITLAASPAPGAPSCSRSPN